jgi:glutaredoxin
MSTLRGLLHRARRLADENLPPEIKEAGRRLRQEVARRAPEVADVLGMNDVEETSTASEPEATPEPVAPAKKTRHEEALERVRTKAEHGLKPEDRLVVIYATDEEKDQVEEIRKCFEGIDTVLRTIDLDQERPQTRTQIAKLTGVMVPPWVYINGKYWGGPFEMVALQGTGDLENVVANRLDEIGAEAKRIGGVHEHFSDDITVQNILERWKLGHILCVDDLDAWYEVDKDGTERFFYQGGPHPVERMPEAAEEIVEGVEAEEFEAQWLLEPAVHLSCAPQAR